MKHFVVLVLVAACSSGKADPALPATPVERASDPWATPATSPSEPGPAAGNINKLVVGGDTLVTFERTALPGGTIGPCKFETALPEDAAQLHVDVTLGGKIKGVTRTIRPFEGSTVTVTLGDSLR